MSTLSQFVSTPGIHDPAFNIFEWYPKYQTCCQYFLETGQYSPNARIIAAFINIKLPYQKIAAWSSLPIAPLSNRQPGAGIADDLSLLPYVRRLVATGFDSADILHCLFGDGWHDDIGIIHEAERKSFLFTAKSDTWLKVKSTYDMEEGQLIPFLRPLRNVSEKEIVNAETSWSDWLAMQDWMLGPRAPPGDTETHPQVGKTQPN